MTQDLSSLEARLNQLDLNTRTQALQALLEHQTPISTFGPSFDPAQDKSSNLKRANMHCHTFYSFNGHGHSPTSLAWPAELIKPSDLDQ